MNIFAGHYSSIVRSNDGWMKGRKKEEKERRKKECDKILTH